MGSRCPKRIGYRLPHNLACAHRRRPPYHCEKIPMLRGTVVFYTDLSRGRLSSLKLAKRRTPPMPGMNRKHAVLCRLTNPLDIEISVPKQYKGHADAKKDRKFPQSCRSWRRRIRRSTAAKFSLTRSRYYKNDVYRPSIICVSLICCGIDRRWTLILAEYLRMNGDGHTIDLGRLLNAARVGRPPQLMYFSETKLRDPVPLSLWKTPFHSLWESVF